MTDFDIKLVKLQRKMIGIFTMSLIPVCLLFGFIGSYAGTQNPEKWYAALSNMFYSNSSSIYVAVLAIVSFFLMTYHGYELLDAILSISAGACLFLQVLFPYEIPRLLPFRENACILPIPASVSVILHCAFGSIAFILFFVIIRFVFTKSNGNETENKKKRNVIYKICAWLVLINFILYLIWGILSIFLSVNLPNVVAVIFQFFMLTACGFAWFVKSEGIPSLND